MPVPVALLWRAPWSEEARWRALSEENPWLGNPLPRGTPAAAAAAVSAAASAFAAAAAAAAERTQGAGSCGEPAGLFDLTRRRRTKKI